MSGIGEIIRLLNLPCRDITALISRSMDTSLPFRERFSVKLHLCYCRACRHYTKQVKLLRDALRRAIDTAAETGPPPLPGLSDEARRRIEESLHGP